MVAELQIRLTPKSKVKEVVQKLSETPEATSKREGDGSSTTVRSLFDVQENVPTAISKVSDLVLSGACVKVSFITECLV